MSLIKLRVEVEHHEAINNVLDEQEQIVNNMLTFLPFYRLNYRHTLFSYSRRRARWGVLTHEKSFYSVSNAGGCRWPLAACESASAFITNAYFVSLARGYSTCDALCLVQVLRIFRNQFALP